MTKLGKRFAAAIYPGHAYGLSATVESVERITRNDPGLISTCLRYIRRMDTIIKPYEDLRLSQRQRRPDAAGKAERT